MSFYSFKKISGFTAVVIILFCASGISFGQSVYVAKYAREANVKVCVTTYKAEADVVVFKTPFFNNSVGNKGVWYFAPTAAEAYKKIFYIQYKHDADLVVYFTTNKEDAGWINKKKKHLFN